MQSACTWEAYVVGRECNSCVGTAAVRSLVDVCEETLSKEQICQTSTLFCNSTHSAFYTS